MASLIQDLGYAFRMLFRSPGFTAPVMLTLALGTGANAAIFTVVDRVLLRPLPFRDPDRLVMIWGTGDESLRISYPDFVDFRDQNQVFEQMAAWWNPELAVTGGAREPERVEGAAVSYNFFSILGVEPALGRSFLPEEDAPGGERVLVPASAGPGPWLESYPACFSE